VTHITVRSLTTSVEVVGYKLYMDNLFTSPDIFDYLCTRNISCCKTVRQNFNGMPRGFDKMALKLKWSDTSYGEWHPDIIGLEGQTRSAHTDKYAQTTNRRLLL